LSASPTTWIDTKGRSLQAKFLRLRGTEVLLDIAGKPTPVPLASLSPESQQIAASLGDSAPALEPGFISLLDDPSAWVQVGPGKLEIKDGVGTTSSPSKWGVAIYSRQQFSDFILKAEFKGVRREFNSGLWLRIPALDQDITQTTTGRYEVGITHPGSDLRRVTGAIWNEQAASQDAVKGNDWNDIEVTVIGQRYVVKLNGQTVNDFIGRKGTSGYIGLEENGEPTAGPVQFRNVRVKPLP